MHHHHWIHSPPPAAIYKQMHTHKLSVTINMCCETRTEGEGAGVSLPTAFKQGSQATIITAELLSNKAMN